MGYSNSRSLRLTSRSSLGSNADALSHYPLLTEETPYLAPFGALAAINPVLDRIRRWKTHPYQSYCNSEKMLSLSTTWRLTPFQLCYFGLSWFNPDGSHEVVWLPDASVKEKHVLFTAVMWFLCYQEILQVDYKPEVASFPQTLPCSFHHKYKSLLLDWSAVAII